MLKVSPNAKFLCKAQKGDARKFQKGSGSGEKLVCKQHQNCGEARVQAAAEEA